MRIWLALVLLTALSGCVTTPVFKPAPARVEVTVLSVIDGRPLAVAATEYDVTMLPLVFELRLTPLQMAEGDLYLRTRLRFIGSSAVQASHQQKVFKAFNPDGYVINLQPRTCYPLCQ